MNFIIGFTKTAAAFHKLKNLRILKPSKRNQSQIRRAMLRQPFIDKVTGVFAKSRGISKGSARDAVNEQILSQTQWGGTIATGKKGTRAYLLSPKKTKQFDPTPGALSYRGIANHEAFHANNKVLGHSEALAHFYGGLKNKKGKNDYGKAFEQAFSHFPKTRPGRAAVEYGGAAGAAYGVHKKLKEDKK